MRVAREEPIAGIPVIRVVERIGFDVQTVVVPVAVDRPEDALPVYALPSIPPSIELLSGLNLIWNIEVRQRCIPILIFFGATVPALMQSMLNTILEY